MVKIEILYKHRRLFFQKSKFWLKIDFFPKIEVWVKNSYFFFQKSKYSKNSSFPKISANLHRTPHPLKKRRQKQNSELCKIKFPTIHQNVSILGSRPNWIISILKKCFLDPISSNGIYRIRLWLTTKTQCGILWTLRKIRNFVINFRKYLLKWKTRILAKK